MDRLKYIIIENDHGHEVPIVFPELLNHSDVGKSFRRTRLDHETKSLVEESAVISAGFCHLPNEHDKADAWGKSVTLKLPSRTEDAEILDRHFPVE